MGLPRHKRMTKAERERVPWVKRRKARKPKSDPLRNNPVVGTMTEAQAERILAEMREEESRGIYR